MPAPYWPQTALLHDHLDGSRPLLTILPYLSKLSGQKYPLNPWASHLEQVKKWFKDPQIDIVKKFSITTGVMQSTETIMLAAKTYVQIRARQGFKYCEATVAPQYHVFGGLTVKEATEAFIEGIKQGEKEYPEIEVNLLPSVGREVGPDEAVALVETFAECDRNYVVGTGLVCDEGAHPPEKHGPMFKRAKELDMRTDCHAGEWCHLPTPFDGRKVIEIPAWDRYQRALLANVYVAVFQLEADRISHAIPLAFDHAIFRGEVLRTILIRNTPVLGCPASNLTSGMIPNLKYLGIRDLLNLGLEYSIHPDDDLFMPEMDEVYQMCNDEYRFTDEEKKQLLINPWLSRFGRRKEHQLPA
jgi:adenosine deaminase